MKLLKQALAVAAMTLSSVEARKTFTQQAFDKKVAAGQYDKRKLLANAVPYQGEQNLRRRAQDGEDQAASNGYAYDYNVDNYPRIDVTANYRIQFNSCLTLQTENYNLLLDNLINYAKAGTLVSIRNYVLFDVCDGENCKAQTYMVDLNTFIEAVIDYGPSSQEYICDACETYGNQVCGTNYNYNNNGGRQLNGGNNVDYVVFNQTMCSLCEDYQCWNENDDAQQEDYASIEEWISGIAQCKLNDAIWNNLNTYSGWMCNADGSGIEIGVFIDQYCRMYNSNLQYSSVMANEDYQYFFQSQDIIPRMFTDIIDCRDLSNVKFVDQNTYDAIAANGKNQGYGYVNEACEALFYGDFAPRSISNCGAAQNWTNAGKNGTTNYQQNGNNGNAQYNNNGQSQNMYQYIQAQQMMYNNYGKGASWYSYDLDTYQVLDGAAVCNKVSAKWTAAGYSTGYSASQEAAAAAASSSSSSGSSSYSGQGTGIQNVYSAPDNSNSFWTWSTGKKASKSSSNSTASTSSNPKWLFPTRNNHSTVQTASARLSPLEIAWIVIGSVVATALFMHVTRKQVLKRRARNHIEKEVYVKTDERGQPLILS